MIERRTVTTLAELRAAYDALFTEFELGEKVALYRRALRLVEAAAGEVILDVGCGAGQLLACARDLGLRGVGVDISLRALARARARGLPDLLLGQGERLPLADASFRRVLCLGNLEHFLDPAAGARELARVLAPDGLCAVLLPNAYYSGDLWRVIRTGRGPDHHQAIDRFATCEEWRDLLEAAGLHVLRVERWDKGKWWKRLLPFHLAYHFLFVARRGGPA
ncbi:MAG: class I SAM-dependent methyltransferase [Planctomycetes bacterium]|nr:class I SAM-dependent methyltransferase [Planctomycetota bacterium]